MDANIGFINAVQDLASQALALAGVIDDAAVELLAHHEIEGKPDEVFVLAEEILYKIEWRIPSSVGFKPGVADIERYLDANPLFRSRYGQGVKKYTLK